MRREKEEELKIMDWCEEYRKAKAVYQDTLSQWNRGIEDHLINYDNKLKERYPEIICLVEIVNGTDNLRCTCKHEILFSSSPKTIIKQALEILSPTSARLRLKIKSVLIDLSRDSLQVNVTPKHYEYYNILITHEDFVKFLEEYEGLEEEL